MATVAGQFVARAGQTVALAGQVVGVIGQTVITLMQLVACFGQTVATALKQKVGRALEVHIVAWIGQAVADLGHWV